MRRQTIGCAKTIDEKFIVASRFKIGGPHAGHEWGPSSTRRRMLFALPQHEEARTSEHKQGAMSTITRWSVPKSASMYEHFSRIPASVEYSIIITIII